MGKRSPFALGLLSSSAVINAPYVFQAETTAYFTRAISGGAAAPTNAQKVGYDRFITAGKAKGWFQKCDAYLIYMGYDNVASLLDLTTNHRDTTKTGNPTWQQFKGWKGDATAANFLNLNWNPSIASQKYVQNSAHVGLWMVSATANSNVMGGNATRIQINGSTQSVGGRINDATTNSGGTGIGSVLNHVVINRTGATALERWVDAVLYSTDTSVSTAMDSSNWTACANDAIGQYSDAQIGAIHWGSALTEDEIVHMRACLRQLIIDLGSNVAYSYTAIDDIAVGQLIPGKVYRTQNAGKSYSYTRDGPKHIFELHDGDLWNGTERSEVFNPSFYPNNTDLWTAHTFKFDGTQTGVWHVQSQVHGPEGGATNGYSPAWALSIGADNVLNVELNYDIGGGQVDQVISTGLTMVQGQYYRVVINWMTVPSVLGTAYFKLYVDSAAAPLFSRTNINLGFSNDGGQGTYHKFGVYRDAATGVSNEIWTYLYPKISTSSLLSYLSSPLPVYS